MKNPEKQPRYRYQIPGIDSESNLTFFSHSERIEIDGELKQDIWSLLKEANGHNTREEIINKIREKGYDPILASDILDDLEALKIIGDSTKAYKLFHELTNNPPRFLQYLSPDEIREITLRPYKIEKDGQQVELQFQPNLIAKLSKERSSCRNFNGEPLSTGQIGEVLANAYSLNRLPIPSAGGLYSLRLYLIIKPGHEMPAGLYQYDPTNETIILFDDDYDQKDIEFALNHDTALHNAPLIVMIAADLERHNEKYGDRGYRYTLLEAGHAAQNIHLTSQELGLASLEYGGFQDEEVSKLLQLEDNESPIVSIGVGYLNKESQSPITIEVLNRLESYYVGKEKPVDELTVESLSRKESTLNIYSCTAHYKSPNSAYSDEHDERYAAGTATSTHLAQIKAIAEAYERYSSGLLRVDYEGSAASIMTDWLDPRLIRPLSTLYKKRNSSLETFTETLNLQWVKGKKISSGKEIYIPVDLVYYPLNEDMLGRKLIAEADSSGVAAHTDENQAIYKALCELIERDALMKNWYSSTSPNQLAPQILTNNIQKRINKWSGKNFDVHILDMSEYLPTIQVVIKNQQNKYPYFSNGASAASTYPEAIEKAFDEAELGIVHAIQNEQKVAISPDMVRSPADHGMFYLHPENGKFIQWLWQGEIISKFKEFNDNMSLIANFDPIVIKLNLRGEPLCVVRIIEQSLIPINFGTGSEYIDHPMSKLRTIPPHIDRIPHYFA